MAEKKIIRIREYLWLAAVILLASLPLFFPGIEGRTGQDLQFHLNRIEGIATEIRAGHIFSRMSVYWLNGYSYPVSIYYGDLLLYLPAFLRVLGVPIVLTYKLFVLLINAVTTAVSYSCFGRIFPKKKVVLLCAAAYTLSAYRFLDLYVRAAVGEYCAMIFLPILALAMWELYADPVSQETAGTKTHPVLHLTIGMTGLIGTHLITAQMAVLTMGILALVLAKKTFTTKRLRVWLQAVGLSVLLNLYFLVPFLDYYINQDVYIKSRMGKERLIQEDGAYLWQFVAFLQNPFGTIISNHEDIMAFHPGILLMGALFAALVLCIVGGVRHKKNKEQKQVQNDSNADALHRQICFLTIASLCLIWISSDLFPWNIVEKIPALGKFLTGVQFPFRYVSILCVTLTILLGLLIEKYIVENSTERADQRGAKMIAAVTGAALLFTVGFFTAEYVLHYEPVYYQSTEDLDSADVGYFEYLRTGTKKDKLTGDITYDGNGSISLTQRNGTDATFSVIGDETDKNSSVTVTLPILNYKGYQVLDDASVDYAIEDSEQNLIQVRIPADYTGRLYVTFRQPLLWTLANWISALTLLGLVLAWGRRIRKPLPSGTV